MVSQIKQSESFKLNKIILAIFGVWPLKKWKKYYKYYTFFYLATTLFLYNFLLTWNLFCTPRNVETMIREVVFYFTELAVTVKVLMILIRSDETQVVLKTLDSKTFAGNTKEHENIVRTHMKNYRKFWKYFTIICNFSYCSLIVFPLIGMLIVNSPVVLPISKYYFLTDEIREQYFFLWYFYQSFSIYGHMIYNVNIDTFMSGIIYFGICQFKILNLKLSHLKPVKNVKIKSNKHDTEALLYAELLDCLKHYDVLLRYCDNVQKITSMALFVEFLCASAIVCIVLCGLVFLELRTETYIFMITYLFVIVSEIFGPCLMGTLLTHESTKLAIAAYNSEWLGRSVKFKRNLLLLMQRANKPIVLMGWKMIPLSIKSFTSIMRTAYSFFTLVRNVQVK